MRSDVIFYRDGTFMSPINDTVGFNQTNTSSVYSDNYSKTTNGVSPQLILGGLILFIAILGCVANAAVLCVLIGSNKSLRGTVNFFVISQTFLDMLTCFLMSISTIAGFLRVSKSSRPMCILIGGGITTMLPLNASIMNMVIITLERYVKIVHPIYHRNHFRRWMTYAAVALCWIDGLSTCVISDFIVGTNCLSLPSSVGKMLATINFVWNYFLPSAIFIICYWRILMVVRHRQIRTDNCSLPTSHNQNASTVVTNQHQQLHDSQRDASSSHSRAADGNANAASGATTISHKQLNILQTMILITATFIILWTPSAFTVLFIHFQVFPQSVTLFSIWLLLIFVNPTLNAFIYAGRLKTVRQSWAVLVDRFK